FYPSIIKKAMSDIENHETKEDWFLKFTEQSFQKDILNDFVDPFEKADYMPICEDDVRLIGESRDDLTKLNMDYINAEFILQNFLYRGISVKPAGCNLVNLDTSNAKQKDCNK